MLIAWENKADSAVLAAGSELATQPGSNVQQIHLSRKWHTAAGVKSSQLTLDMLSSVACSILAVLGTNLTPTATYRVRASDVDPAALATLLLDTTTLAAGVKAGYGAIYKQFTPTTARYWRVDLADTAVPSNLQIGRLVLAPVWQPTVNMELDWQVTALDESPVDESYGGQEYSDPRPQKRVLQFSLDFMSEAEMYGNAFALARAAGVVKDILAIPEISSAFVSEQSVWGRMVVAEPLRNPRLGLYRQRFTVKERL